MSIEIRHHSQHKSDACRALTPGDYTYRHQTAANKHLAIKRELSNALPKPYYKYDPQSVSGSCKYKLYHDRSTTNDRTVQNSPDTSNKHDYHTVQFPTLTTSQHLHWRAAEDFYEELIRISQLTRACVIPQVLSTEGIIRNKLHDTLKLRNIRPVLYILMQKGVVLGYMQDSLEVFGRTVYKKCLVTETSSCLRKS